MSTEPTYQRLYVGSLHFSLTDEDVRQIFEPFGPLDFVNLHKGRSITVIYTTEDWLVSLDPETGRSKGFGFIQYKKADDAKQALEKMNGFELAGRNVRFCFKLSHYTRVINLKRNIAQGWPCHWKEYNGHGHQL